MSQVYIETIAIYFVWMVAMLLLHGKVRRIIAIVGAVLSVGLILLFTIHGRLGISNRKISLIPFITFANAKTQPEFYRTMYMNMLLFLPFGLSMPFVIQKTMWYTILVTILLASGLSICIEIVQYVFSMGKCEVDDVIMNTFGVIIGSTSFMLYCLIYRINKIDYKIKNKKRNINETVAYKIFI